MNPKVGDFNPTRSSESGSISVEWAGGHGTVKLSNLPQGSGAAVESALRGALGSEKPKRPRLAPASLSDLDDIFGGVIGQISRRAEPDDTLDKGVELIGEFLSNLADTVPSTATEAAELGEAAGAFAAKALKTLKANRPASPPSREDVFEAIAKGLALEGTDVVDGNRIDDATDRVMKLFKREK